MPQGKNTVDEKQMAVRPTFEPFSPEDRAGQDRGAGTLVLRDGSRATLYRALAEDAHRIRAFLERLSPDELGEVAGALELEEGELTAFLERLSREREDGEASRRETGGQAFWVEGGEEREVVAFGAYRLRPPGDGEAQDRSRAVLALAVDPALRNQGLATLLLSRLSVLAARRGVGRLTGHVPADHEALLDLFRRSSFEEVGEEEDQHRFEMDTRAAEPGEDLEALAGPAGGQTSGESVRARVYAAASLRPLFHPRSVAVAGASRDPASVGHRILDALIRGGFEGPVYPVNPKAEHVASVRAYPSVSSVGKEVDLVVVSVPQGVVSEVVDDAAEAGARALVVITAGFAEVGEEGEERQRQLLAQVRGHGMRMVGPNCLGALHTHPEVRLNASFAPNMPPRGAVGLCSQSGALGVAIIALARRLGLGMSSFVSVGNKADVSGNDLLEYWEEDGETGVMLFYLESFGDPRRFARLARRVGRTKPVVVTKAGRTQAGSRAASSHTAALTAADTTVEALFRQTGVLRADTLEQMFGIARALTEQPVPRGRRVAVVTNAGGPAILCTDALEAAGVEVETLSEPTRQALAEFLPSAASLKNPVDMIASAGPETYRKAMEVVLAAEEVDAVVVIYTPVGMFDTAEVGRAILEGVAAARGGAGESGPGAGKPVLATLVGEEEETYLLGAGGEDGERIPVYTFPEEIGRVLGKVCDYAEWRRSDPGVFPEIEDQDLEGARQICRRALEERGEGWLSVEEARRALAAAGLQVAKGGVATSADEAVQLAESVGFPVAVKLASLQIQHKTEIGGVRLDLADADSVREAYEGIRKRLEEAGQEEAMQGVLVQPMLEGAAEVLIGVDQDPVFGPVIAFGLGGIHVEILKDVAFRVSPLTDRDAREMVREIKGFPLLEGYRGYPEADVEALEEALLRISRLVEAVHEIGELDLNPIFALEPGEGYRVADARIKVRPAG